MLKMRRKSFRTIVERTLRLLVMLTTYDMVLINAVSWLQMLMILQRHLLL